MTKILRVDGIIFEYWYDRSVRLWTITERDEAGNQIGEASYTATRPTKLNVRQLTAL